MNLINTALKYHQEGEYSKAEAIYKLLINKSNNKDADALHLLGCIFIEKKQYIEAIKLIKKAIKLRKHQNYYLNLGNAYRLNNNINEAVESYCKCLKVDNNNYEANYNLAELFYKINEIERSLSYARKCLLIDPQKSDQYNLIGMINEKNNKIKEAYTYYVEALKRDNDNINSLLNIGNIYYIEKEYIRSIACYKKILEINPLETKALYNYAIVLNELGNFGESIKLLEKANQISPTDNKILAYIATNYKEMNKPEMASKYFEKINEIKVGEVIIVGEMLNNYMNMCDWNKFNAFKKIINEEIKNGEAPISGFAYMAISDDEELQFLLAKNLVKNLNKNTDIQKSKSEMRLIRKQIYKIAFLSSDIRKHPIGQLMIEVFKNFEAEKFHKILIYNNSIEDEIYLQSINYFDDVINIKNVKNCDAVELLRKKNIDIVIDLNGFTKGNRIELILNRIAPVQINYLGYAGTMGTSQYDFILSDNNALPFSSQKFFSEEITHMKFFMANPSERFYRDYNFSKNDFGIKEYEFVFASMNNSNKITENRILSWIEILNSCENSKLLIMVNSEQTEKNLRQYINGKSNINNFIFIKNSDYDYYMSIYKIIDLFLDTEYINAGTTAADSIFMNKPILTLPGRSYASRYCYAILKAIHLEELIASTINDYIDRAINLRNNKIEYNNILDKIFYNKKNIFDSKSFTESFKTAVLNCIEKKLEKQNV